MEASVKTNKKKKRIVEGDFWVLILTIAISLFGIIMEFSSSYYVALSEDDDAFLYLKKAGMWFAIGMVLFFIASLLPMNFYKAIAPFVIIIGFGLLALLYVPSLAVTLNNATRWLQIGPITIMPGEIMKTCMILFMAWFYSRWPERINEFVWNILILVIVGAAAFIIYKQPNLSTAITLAAICIGIMFFAGLSWWYVVGALGAGAAAFAGVLIIKGGYFLTRFTGFWDPFQDALGSGYQVVQGLLAIGSGGMFGIGLGNSVQKAFYLPEPQTDFILAIIGEELGLFGMTLLFAAFFGLAFAIFNVAMKAKTKFEMLLAGGIGLHLILQVILNVAVVSAAMPATGIALPLVTYGGNTTSLFLAELGIVYNISRRAKVVD